MRRRTPRHRHRGHATVEYALVLPAFIMMFFGTITFGVAFFTQHQVATLAREGARWAAVHGANYVSDYNASHSPPKTATTSTDVYNNAIVPHAGGLNLSGLTYTVAWLNSNQLPTNGGVPNTVTVTINYSWAALPYLSARTLTGRAVMRMQY
jgi:Flp pilus assembly protein TadG